MRRIKLKLTAIIPVATVNEVFKPTGTCWHIDRETGRECGKPTTTLLCEEHAS
jgi:hypothetical protein